MREATSNVQMSAKYSQPYTVSVVSYGSQKTDLLRVSTLIIAYAYAATKHCREVQNDLSTNADEADLRVWLHCVKSSGVRKILHSPTRARGRLYHDTHTHTLTFSCGLCPSDAGHRSRSLIEHGKMYVNLSNLPLLHKLC